MDEVKEKEWEEFQKEIKEIDKSLWEKFQKFGHKWTWEGFNDGSDFFQASTRERCNIFSKRNGSCCIKH